MKVQDVSIDKIKPYKNNPRDNEAGIDAVANSIKQFKWQQPIVVDKDNVIIVGHTRYLAAKKLGLKEVPVKVATGLTPEQVKAYRLADNKTGELTDWNLDLLDDELDSIIDINMSDFGFDKLEDVNVADEKMGGGRWLMILGYHRFLLLTQDKANGKSGRNYGWKKASNQK